MSEPASETGGVLVQIVVGIIFALTAILIAASWYRIRRDARRSTHGLWLVASLTMIWISMTALAAMVAPESSISVLIAVLPMLVVVLGLAASALLLVANTPIVVRREGLRMATLVPAALGLTIVVTLALGWWWLFSAGYAHWRMGALPLGIIPGAIIIAELVAYTAYAFVYPSVHGRIGESEVIVVLGAGLSGDRVTPLLAGRLDRAVRVYDDLVAAGRRPWIVVSGGKGSDEVVSEAAAMARYLAEETHVPDDAVLQEDASTNTRENLENSLQMVADRGISTTQMVVVTSNFHVLRSASLSRQLGIPGAIVVGSPTAWYYLPSGFLREFAATVVHYRKQNLLTWAVISGLWLALFSVALIISSREELVDDVPAPEPPAALAVTTGQPVVTAVDGITNR